MSQVDKFNSQGIIIIMDFEFLNNERTLTQDEKSLLRDFKIRLRQCEKKWSDKDFEKFYVIFENPLIQHFFFLFYTIGREDEKDGGVKKSIYKQEN